MVRPRFRRSDRGTFKGGGKVRLPWNRPQCNAALVISRPEGPNGGGLGW